MGAGESSDVAERGQVKQHNRSTIRKKKKCGHRHGIGGKKTVAALGLVAVPRSDSVNSRPREAGFPGAVERTPSTP